jgi:hypothetical protein
VSSIGRGILLAIGLLVFVSAGGALPGIVDAATRSCKPVVNPYPGTRYEGVDLSGIEATGIRCGAARRVARGAHRMALGLAPTPNGTRTFNWHGWRVTGNLRPPSDRYLARRGGDRVRWRF